MRDFLADMARSSAARVAEATRRESAAALRERALDAPAAPPLVLEAAGFDLIAEIKLRSPSRGSLTSASSAADVVARAVSYARAGAAAISVLTEPDEFGGSLAHLERAARAVSVPVLRKDFLVDPYQVLEARAAGAGGVLVILRLVDDETLAALLETSAKLGLFVLLEAFDETDVARARALLENPPRARILVGVNARDLATLAADPGRHAALAAGLPPDVPRVAESAVADAESARRVVRLGYRLALVGETLMRAADPEATARALIAAGRAEARTSCASA